MTALAELTTTEAKLALRDPTSLMIPIGLPLLIIVMNGTSADRTPEAGLGGLPGFDAVLIPLTLAMVVVLLAVVNMPTLLTTYRTTGVLRRLATTPASPTLLLLAQVVVAFFGMIAVAGVFGPVEALPGWLQVAGEHTPYGALAAGLTDAWTGTAPDSLVLAALAATAVGGSLVAALRFRWDTST